MKYNIKKAFTLVELIVVITIVAVLATIASNSYLWYNLKVRDSVRLSDIKTVYTGVNVYKAKNWKVPAAKNPTNIQIAGQTIQFQSDLEEEILGTISVTQGTVDPKTNEKYTYITDNRHINYQVGAFLERDDDSYALISNTFAEDESFFYSKWWELWIIQDNSWDLVHRVVTIFNLTDALWDITVYISRYNKFTGSWPEYIESIK